MESSEGEILLPLFQAGCMCGLGRGNRVPCSWIAPQLKDHRRPCFAVAQDQKHSCPFFEAFAASAGFLLGISLQSFDLLCWWSHLIWTNLHETCKWRLSCMGVIFILINAKYLYSAEEEGKYQQFIAISGLYSSLMKEILLMTKTLYVKHSSCLRWQLRPP